MADPDVGLVSSISILLLVPCVHRGTTFEPVHFQDNVESSHRKVAAVGTAPPVLQVTFANSLDTSISDSEVCIVC